ncbi:hypothetical protein ACQ4PT_044857 [Festuca glaucescens]
MWRGGASAARALRSRLLADAIHHPSGAIAPIVSARAACSAPSAAAEAAAAAATVSSVAGSTSDVLRHYGRCYWELSKARLRWAAAASEVSLNSMILPAALYFWQLPHFMALAYLCREDYLAGGYRMLSFADPTGKRTAWVSLRNCLYMLPLGLFAYNCGLTSEWFSFEASLLTMGLTIGALSFVLDPTTKSARRMFHGSLLYLPALMAGLILHRLPNEQKEHNIHQTSEMAGVLCGAELRDEERARQKREDQKKHSRVQSRPPVAYASVAPFPFLPVPVYVSTQAHEL